VGTITSANISISLSVPGVFDSDQILQGFGVDDAFTQAAHQKAETRMGVDALLSGGFTPAIKPFTITFMPDSPSILIFDQWGAAEEAAKEAFIAGMTITAPSLGKVYDFNVGFLKDFKSVPDAKKLMESQTFSIDWQDIIASPI
jgi:hypothetical protein